MCYGMGLQALAGRVRRVCAVLVAVRKASAKDRGAGANRWAVHLCSFFPVSRPHHTSRPTRPSRGHQLAGTSRFPVCNVLTPSVCGPPVFRASFPPQPSQVDLLKSRWRLAAATPRLLPSSQLDPLKWPPAFSLQLRYRDVHILSHCPTCFSPSLPVLSTPSSAD